MTKKTNNDIKRSSIKSIIFSGLLAFSFMGIDNAFCENNANKAIYNILDYYRGPYSLSLVKSLKANISIILDTKIEGESLFDLLVRYQKNNFYLYEQNKGEAIKTAFADTKYTVSCIGNRTRMITFSPKNDKDGPNISISFESATDDPYMTNKVCICIVSPIIEGDRVTVLHCVVKKQKNGEYQLTISIV